MSGLQVKTCTNGEIILQEDTIRKFKESLRGELILSDDAGYDDARSIWNAMIDRRPALIVRCLGVTDVVTCVNFAREHGLILSIKSGGHNISGLAVCEGGLMLDMSRMRGVWVDPSTRTARAQAGCLLGDVDRETQLHGLAAVGFVLRKASVSFDRATSGAFPEDNVIPSGDGSTLYGLTQAGGANDPMAVKKYGTVFAVTVSRLVCMFSGASILARPSDKAQAVLILSAGTYEFLQRRNVS